MVLESRPRVDEVLQQRGQALVQFRQLAPHGREVLLVRVPALVVDGDVGNAALDQSPGHQARLAEGVAAVAVAKVVFLLRQIEHLAGVAQDQVVGLLLRVFVGGELGVAGQGMAERVELFQQVAAVLLPLVGDALGHDAFDGEPLLGRIAAGGEGLVAGAQEAGLGEPPLRLGEHDVRRQQSAVTGLVASEQRDHGPGAGIDLAGRRAAGRSAPCRPPSRGS